MFAAGTLPRNSRSDQRAESVTAPNAANQQVSRRLTPGLPIDVRTECRSVGPWDRGHYSAMEHRTPSKTAYAVARMRADHQILDGGQIFSDPYACAILGEQPEQTVMTLQQDPNGLVARTYMASRSRIGEDWLGAACD